MKFRKITFAAFATVLAILMVACGAGAAGQAGQGGRTGGAGAGAQGSAAPSPVPVPTAALAPTVGLVPAISATGEVKAAQDANLTFPVQGIVEQVLVKEGDVITKGQTLAILDTRSFDQKIEQAQAALDSAQAAEDALTEKPSSADLAAAQVQIRQAQIALTQARVNQPQNNQSAQSSVASAQANLEAQRDKLSQAKTSADSNVQQNALALTQAQAAYAKAKSDWDYIQETGRNPAQPSTTNAQGKSTPNKINDSASAQYYQAFVQAEAAMHKAELTLQQSQVDAEAARQAEVTGIQSAEQQVAQAQSSADKLNLPSNADTIAQAQAGVDAAKANMAKLNPAPTASDKARAQASVKQAQVTLDAAKLDREHAELHAPFDGIVAQVNIDPGDPSSTSGQVPMYVIDVSKLHIDANVSDVDIGQITVGQAVQVSVDVGTGKAYTGKVSYIAPAATVSGNVRTYLVRVVLDDQTGLRPGMSARVRFTIQ